MKWLIFLCACNSSPEIYSCEVDLICDDVGYVYPEATCAEDSYKFLVELSTECKAQAEYLQCLGYACDSHCESTGAPCELGE